jgi:hypothetical protein
MDDQVDCRHRFAPSMNASAGRALDQLRGIGSFLQRVFAHASGTRMQFQQVELLFNHRHD